MRAEVTPNRRGMKSRELVLDAAERVMAEHGFEAATLARVVAEAGIPMSSVYHYFGSKDGILLAVMERGADRFFAAIPTSEDTERQLAVLSTLQSQHPDFLRLFYMLSLERSDDPVVAAVVHRVRDTAITRFRDAIVLLLPADAPPSKAERVVTELTALAVALSDGVYFAEQLEPDATDVELMYRRLSAAVTALIPILLEEK